MVQQVLDCEVLLLLCFFYFTFIHSEFNVASFFFLPRNLLLLSALANQKIKLICDAHSFVLKIEIFVICLRYICLSLDSSFLILVFLLFNFLGKCVSILIQLLNILSFLRLLLNEFIDLLVIPVLLSYVCLFLSMVALI
jgi:hypothetical protein